jgi:hypothetical protein
LNLSGSVGGLVNASLSFLAKTGKSAGATTNAFIRDTAVPMGYWYTGNDSGSDDLKEWTLSMTQDAELAYLNQNTPEPGYIRVGLVSYTLDVTSYNELGADQDKIKIATTTFTLTGKTSGKGFSFGGVSDMGTYHYTFETGSDDGYSDTLVIST